MALSQAGKRIGINPVSASQFSYLPGLLHLRNDLAGQLSGNVLVLDVLALGDEAPDPFDLSYVYVSGFKVNLACLFRLAWALTDGVDIIEMRCVPAIHTATDVLKPIV